MLTLAPSLPEEATSEFDVTAKMFSLRACGSTITGSMNYHVYASEGGPQSVLVIQFAAFY